MHGGDIIAHPMRGAHCSRQASERAWGDHQKEAKKLHVARLPAVMPGEKANVDNDAESASEFQLNADSQAVEQCRRS